MSQQLALDLQGIKRQEAEKRNLRHEPPIPFVPPVSQSLKKDKKEHTFKVKIHHGLEENVPVFCGGNNEDHLGYLATCEGLIRRKELHTSYDGYHKEYLNATEDLQMHQMVKPDDVPDAEDDNQPQKVSSTEVKKKKNKSSSDLMKEWLRREQVLTDRIKNAKTKEEQVLHEAYDLCEMLQSEEIHKVWTNAVNLVCETKDWKDENGEV